MGSDHEGWWAGAMYLLSTFNSGNILTVLISSVGGMLMVEIFSIAKSFPLTKLFYLEKISMAKSLHIMNLSAVGDKMT